MKWVFMLKREQEKEREREREEKRVYKLRKGMQVVLDLLGLFFPSFPNESHNTYKVGEGGRERKREREREGPQKKWVTQTHPS
jgi:hypothetical protein